MKSEQERNRITLILIIEHSAEKNYRKKTTRTEPVGPLKCH